MAKQELISSMESLHFGGMWEAELLRTKCMLPSWLSEWVTD